MLRFVIDESHLRRLTPNARHELLTLLRGEMKDLNAHIQEQDWSPDYDRSYPLTVDEAATLLNSVTESCRAVLQVFADNYDGERGEATLAQLMAASGQDRHEDLAGEIATITQALRNVVGHHDAWIFNWRPEDWSWDEEKQAYVDGRYFMSATPARSLREALAAHA